MLSVLRAVYSFPRMLMSGESASARVRGGEGGEHTRDGETQGWEESQWFLKFFFEEQRVAFKIQVFL